MPAKFAFVPHVEVLKEQKQPKQINARHKKALASGVGTASACDYADLFYPGLKLPSLRKFAKAKANAKSERKALTKQVAAIKAVEKHQSLHRVFTDGEGEEMVRVELFVSNGVWHVTREGEDFSNLDSSQSFPPEKQAEAQRLYSSLLVSEAIAHRGRRVNPITKKAILI